MASSDLTQRVRLDQADVSAGDQHVHRQEHHAEQPECQQRYQQEDGVAGVAEHHQCRATVHVEQTRFGDVNEQRGDVQMHS